MNMLPCAAPFALASSIFAQTSVVSQPAVTADANVGFGFYSHIHARPTRNYLHADDFRLTSAATVNRVVWWGESEGVLTDDLSNFSDFGITFYTARAASNGRPVPDQIIATAIFPIADAQATATGRFAPNGAAEHRFEVDLPQAVSLNANTWYFVAIGARCVSNSGDAFMWQDSDTYNGYTVSWSYQQNRWIQTQDTDSAFELINVPAPATLVGLLALAPLRQRRR